MGTVKSRVLCLTPGLQGWPPLHVLQHQPQTSFSLVALTSVPRAAWGLGLGRVQALPRPNPGSWGLSVWGWWAAVALGFNSAATRRKTGPKSSFESDLGFNLALPLTSYETRGNLLIPKPRNLSRLFCLSPNLPTQVSGSSPLCLNPPPPLHRHSGSARHPVLLDQYTSF